MSFSSLNLVPGASRNPITLYLYLSFSLEGFISSISRAIHTEISLSVVTALECKIQWAERLGDAIYGKLENPSVFTCTFPPCAQQHVQTVPRRRQQLQSQAELGWGSAAGAEPTVAAQGHRTQGFRTVSNTSGFQKLKS